MYKSLSVCFSNKPIEIFQNTTHQAISIHFVFYLDNSVRMQAINTLNITSDVISYWKDLL